MVSRKVRLAHWWYRTGLITRIFVLLIGIVLFSVLVYLQKPADPAAFLKSNIVVFALVNINIIVICVLAFLIGRHVVKLIFDRKHQILGSKLRLKLVTAFVGLALIPTAVIYFLASGLLNQAMEGWFNKQVEDSIKGSVAIAQRYYDILGKNVQKSGTFVARDISAKSGTFYNDKLFNKYLTTIRKQQELFAISIYDLDANEIAQSAHSIAAFTDFSPPKPSIIILRKSSAEEPQIIREEQGATQFIRSYNLIKYKNNPAVVISTLRVSPKISQIFRQVNDSYREYEQMKLFKNPLKSGYILTLALITGLILFSAVWIGFYIARELTVPIQKLAEGTQAVAKGDYDFQIKVIGDDEVAALVKSFNKMTIDLKTSRSDAENKRVLIEAILASLAVGVIALNKDGTISSVNSAAINMFNLRAFDNIINRRLQDVLDAETAKHLLTLASKATNKKNVENIEADLEIDVTILGARRRLYCTAGLVQDKQANDMGRVLIFDDITDLIQAQQMIAWREVARRIAHEIKNPLTPLQLCAQRLQKLVVNHKDNQPIIDSTETIVEHVASIKRLADEFAKFARMPSVKFLETDLDLLISSVISGYLDTNPEVVFKSIRDPKLKIIYADSEQLRRCFINLIDNAIFAMEQQASDKEKSITIKAALSSSKVDTVVIEIIDTGPGIKDADKIRIFEPYFTTRTTGTGLGLAVVSSIIADHRGTIRVFDNQPTGARMVVELPVDPRNV